MLFVLISNRSTVDVFPTNSLAQNNLAAIYLSRNTLHDNARALVAAQAAVDHWDANTDFTSTYAKVVYLRGDLSCNLHIVIKVCALYLRGDSGSDRSVHLCLNSRVAQEQHHWICRTNVNILNLFLMAW